MTLREVAILSECSVATVSKAFKNSPEVSEETKKRVIEAAKKCGYIKKAVSHTAVLGGIKTVVMGDEKAEYKKDFEAITKLCKEEDFKLLYVMAKAKDTIALKEQIGAVGAIVCGIGTDKEDILYYNGEIKGIKTFLERLASLKPKRASRSKKGVEAKLKAKPQVVEKKKETVTEAPKPKEEIWLL